MNKDVYDFYSILVKFTLKNSEYNRGTIPKVSKVENNNPKIIVTAIGSHIGPPSSHNGNNPHIVVIVVRSIGRSFL